MKKVKNVLLPTLLAVGAAAIATSCGGGASKGGKIGVIMEDDSSGEFLAWKSYLNTVGGDLGYSFEFVKTDSSASEVNAINTFASKGYKGVLLLSDDDVLASTKTADKNDMWVLIPTGNLLPDQYAEISKLSHFVGSVAPYEETDYEAGYNMAKHFVENLERTNFTVFGGAAHWGVSMHYQRLAGMFTYLCEDATTSYDGVKTHGELVGKIAGKGIDPEKFVSEKYDISGYMQGFDFDAAFSTTLTNSMLAGGTAILSVGASDAVTGIAYGIASNVPAIDASTLTVGGVDAITSAYLPFFDMGYTYDCGKYASAMGPGLILLQNAIEGHPIKNAEGLAPQANLNYWVATSKEQMQEILKVDDAEAGFCYNAKVINHYDNTSYAEFAKLCGSTYAEAKAIHDQYGK